MDRITGILSNTTQNVSGSLSQTSQSVSGSLNSVSDHTRLTGRDAPKQHPIDSINNLETELDWRPSVPMSNSDIQAIMES